METATLTLLRRLLGELEYALAPLTKAVRRPDRLYLLLGSIGWNLEGLLGSDGSALLDSLLEVRTALDQLAAVTDAADAGTSIDEVVTAAESAWQTVEERLPGLAQALAEGSVPVLDPTVQETLVSDLLALLLTRYLSDRMPIPLAIAEAVGVLADQVPPAINQPGNPTALRHAVRRRLLRVDRLQALGRDPATAILGELRQLAAADGEVDLQALADRAGRRLKALLSALQQDLSDASLQVDVGSIRILGLELGLTEELTLPLPELAGIEISVELAADSAALAWLPEPATDDQPLVLFSESGFTVSVLGPNANLAGGGAFARGLTLSMVGDTPTLALAGGLAVDLPLDLLADDTGGALAISAQGQVVLSLGTDGQVTPELGLARAELAVSGLQIGGAGGPVLDGMLVVEGLSFPLEPGFPGLKLEAEGNLTLGANSLAVHARLDGDGFLVESSGQVELGDGVRLAPIGVQPILSLHWSASAAGGTVSGSLAGRLVLDEIAAELAFSGSFLARVESGGIQLESLSAATALLAELPLPGNLALTGAGLSVNLSAGSLTLGISGQIRIPAADGSSAGLGVSGVLGLELVAGQPRIATLDAQSELVGTLRLPGNLVLEQARAVLSYDNGAALASLIGRIALGQDMSVSDDNGVVELDATVEYDAADPLRIIVSGRLDAVDLALGDEVRLFGAGLEFFADSGSGGADPEGSLLVSGAAGGLLRRSGTGLSGAQPNHYRLALTGVGAGFAFTGDGFTLSWSAGILSLPPEVFAGGGGGTPSVELAGADAAEALTLSYSAGALSLVLSGRLILRHFGLALPGGTGLSAHLEQAVLVLDGANPPLLQDLDGSIRLPLPDDQGLVIGLQDVAWDLAGLPTGSIALDSALDAIDLGGGFLLRILGSDPNDPTAASTLTVTRDGDHWGFVLDGGLSITAPLELLSEADDGTATVALSGHGIFGFSTDPGHPPTVSGLALGLSAQRLRFGGGLLVEDAEIMLDGIDALIDANATEPLRLGFSGTIQATAGTDTITLGLEGATFTFVDGPIPAFGFAGISLGSSTPVLGGLITLREIGIGFDDEDRALLPPPGEPALLAPDNIELTLSADLAVDTSSGVLIGGVRDTVMSLDSEGRPVLELDGFSVGIDGLDIGITSLTGGLAVQGLTGANPPRLVGQLGGQYQGMGLEFLCALGVEQVAGVLPVVKPLGACLDVSTGSTGISLAYGFTLNGASGGISFQNSNASPCDFKAYLGLDDAGNEVPPYQPAAPGAEASAAPGVGSARPLPYGDCPSPCPPASMNPLCQPHPDASTYPNRAILRFSSLDAELLESIGLRDVLDDWFPDLNNLDTDGLAAKLRELLADLLPAPSLPISVPDPALQEILNDPLGFLSQQFVQLLAAAADAAMAAADPPTPWELVSEIAHAGIPCPDITLQVTGTFSYVGVSVFASVTGGVTVSSTGTIGVLGWLNIFNIPVGQLRAFLTLTNELGEPDPSLCGDLRLGVGPLDVGQVGFIEYFQGDIDALPGLLQQAATVAGLPVQVVVDELAAALPGLAVPADPWVLIESLTLEQAAALVSRLGQRAVEGLPNSAQVQEFLIELLDLALHIYDPRAVFCGSITPKLFGLPLMGEGLVAFRGWTSMTDLGGQFAFSPSYLIGRVLPGADFLAGMDRAALGFAMAFPDPREMLLDGLSGQVTDLGAYLDDGLERLLEKAVFTFSYEIAPFGLSLVRSAGRVLLPRLASHPDDPDNADTWDNPDTNPALPDRLSLLGATLQGTTPGGHLADVLWDGRLNDLELPGYSWPAQDLFLSRDYFPHGGLVGAGYLQLPRALVEAPPLDLIATILDPDAPPLERLSGVAEYISDYLRQSVEQGNLSFYIPAPNPPLFRVDGDTLGPRALLESMMTLDLGDVPLPELPGYRADLAFLLGELNGSLLGVPLGRARIEGVPPSGPGGTARLLVTAEIPSGSWLSALVDSAELRFELTQPPPVPISARFQALAAALSPDPAAVSSALDGLSTALDQTDENLSRVGLPGLDTGDDGPLAAAEALRESLRERREGAVAELRSGAEALAPLWQQAQQLAASGVADAFATTTDVLQQISEAFIHDLPRIALSAEVTGVHLPSPLSDWIQVSGGLELYAYSPWFDPEATGEDVQSRARRSGGILLRVDLQLSAGIGPSAAPLLNLDLPQTELFLIPQPGGVADPPPIRCHREIEDLPIPGTDLNLDSVWLKLDSEPRDGDAYLQVGGELDALRIGKLGLEGGDEAPLAATLSVRPVTGQVLGALDLELAPSEVRLPLLGADTRLLVHGADSLDQAARFATHGPWSIAVTVLALELISPYDPDDPPLLTIDPAVLPEVTLEGDGLSRATLVLAIPGNAASLFPGIPVLTQVLDTSFELRADSDGDIDGRLDLPPLDFGLLRLHGDSDTSARIAVRMRPYGFGLPNGFRVSLVGLSSKRIRLRSCVLDGFGYFSVSATSRTFALGDWVKFSASSLRAWNGPDGAGLTLRRPRLRLLPNAEHFRKLSYLSLAIETLAIASDGSFAAAVDDALFEIPGLFELRGRLEIGNQPLPGEPLNPYLRLIDATLSAAPLPDLHGDLNITPDAITANVTVDALEIPGIFRLDPGAWQLDIAPGDHLRLNLTDAVVELLGASLQLDTLEVEVAAGTWALSAELGQDATVIPGLLELTAGTLEVSVGPAGASIRVGLRALSTPAGWALDFDAWLRVGSGGLDAGIGGSGFTFLDLPGLLRVAAAPLSRLRITPHAAGWRVGIDGLSVTLLGRALSLDSPPIPIDGAVELTWSPDTQGVPLGPFDLHPPAAVEIDLNLLDQTSTPLAIRLPDDTSLGSTLAAWPEDGVTLPPIPPLGENGDFTLSLPEFSLHGITLAGTPAITLQRADGEVSLSLSSQQDFLGVVTMALSFEVDDQGQASGTLSGEFDLTAVGFPDLGDCSLSYDSSNDEYAFQGTVSGFGVGPARVPDHLLQYGTAGGRVCAISTDQDGNDVLGPCLPP